MKKLISAAAAMAMAASMVGSAVPFATGAADSEAGLYFDIITNRDGKTKASTTISKDDITAGDVTIPVGLYADYAGSDIKSIMAEWTVTASDGGDASEISFAPVMAGSTYYTEDQTVKIGDLEITSKSLIGFSGKATKGAKGNKWSQLGEATVACKDYYEYANIKDAWGSIAWLPNPETGYAYTGAKSDDFPVYVFEVTFPKETKAGTYTIDFLNYEDKKNNNVPSTMIEIAGQKRLTPTTGLSEKGITFTIEGDSAPQTTTTEGPQTTTAPQTTPGPQTTTTSNTDEYPVKDDFTIEPEARTAKPGDLIENIPVFINSNGRSVSTLVFELPEDLPEGWTVEPSELGCYCSELEGIEFKKLDKTYNVNTIQPGTGHPMPIIDGAEMVYINIKVPEDAQPGDYEYFFKRFFIVEDTKPELIQYNGTILPGKITIEGDAPQTTTTDAPGTTTTKSTDTTKAPDTTTTKTPGTTTGGELTPLYGDASDDGKVNIADVVVLNKWLHNNEDYAMTDQGKLNSNCCDVSAGKIDAEDSDAIIKSIVHLVTLPCAASDLK